jgi:hypothetical protein
MSKIRAAMEMMGRSLPGRSQNISQQVLGNPGRRQEMMGRNIPGRGAPRGLIGAASIPKDISKLEALTKTAGIGALAGAGAADMTDGFTKAGSIQNSIFADPEELGRQAAKAKMSLQDIMDKARGKAEELGQAPQLYMFQIQNGYQDEINKQQAMMAPPEEEGLKPVSLLFSGGGEASFPDLTGDGKVTQADILKGRGVYAEGGETIDDELAGMQMSEEDAMAEIQSIAPQTKMIEQLVMAVMQMVQQGISEQEIINFLKEQGLDDEDIEDLFTMVMQQMQQGQQDPIASELQEMQ